MTLLILGKVSSRPIHFSRMKVYSSAKWGEGVSCSQQQGWHVYIGLQFGWGRSDLPLLSPCDYSQLPPFSLPPNPPGRHPPQVSTLVRWKLTISWLVGIVFSGSDSSDMPGRSLGLGITPGPCGTLAKPPNSRRLSASLSNWSCGQGSLGTEAPQLA